MAGLVIVGLDFGMALTKCAVAIQPPNQSNLERLVVAFEDDDGHQRFHLPSCVWTNATSIALYESELEGRTQSHLGLKRALLDAWAESDVEFAPPAYVTECAFFALSRILARARRAIEVHLASTYPGAAWTWVVNAAIPSERGVGDQPTAREVQMKSLMSRVLAYVEANPNIDGPTELSSISREVAEASRIAETMGTSRRVMVVRESLAAALFALQADDAEAGTWLTVDVGALTTDTSLFFFSPDENHRVAAYYSMASRKGGMHAVALALARVRGVSMSHAHAALAGSPVRELSETTEFKELETAVNACIRETLRAAWNVENAFSHLFRDSASGRECRFQLLLVGGGSSHEAMREVLSKWRWHAFHHAPPTAVGARIPYAFGVLWSDGSADHLHHPMDVDHPILAVACGLTQQPWDMPRFDTLAQGKSGGRVPPKDRLEQDWWGGN